MSEDSLDTCRVCDAPAERVLSAPAIHFKGSGFYTTDYARKGKKPDGEGAPAKSEKKSEGSSESKSDSSSSTKSTEKSGSSGGSKKSSD